VRHRLLCIPLLCAAGLTACSSSQPSAAPVISLPAPSTEQVATPPAATPAPTVTATTVLPATPPLTTGPPLATRTTASRPSRTAAATRRATPAPTAGPATPPTGQPQEHVRLTGETTVGGKPAITVAGLTPPQQEEGSYTDTGSTEVLPLADGFGVQLLPADGSPSWRWATLDEALSVAPDPQRPFGIYRSGGGPVTLIVQAYHP